MTVIGSTTFGAPTSDGADILGTALELAPTPRSWVAGRTPGNPFTPANSWIRENGAKHRVPAVNACILYTSPWVTMPPWETYVEWYREAATFTTHTYDLYACTTTDTLSYYQLQIVISGATALCAVNWRESNSIIPLVTGVGNINLPVGTVKRVGITATPSGDIELWEEPQGGGARTIIASFTPTYDLFGSGGAYFGFGALCITDETPKILLWEYDDLQVPPDEPEISVTSPVEITAEEGTDPAAVQITVSNIGTGTLNPSLGSINYINGSGWLSISILGMQITVDADATALTPGVYEATFDVIDEDAINSPQTVTVIFTVTEAPPVPTGECFPTVWTCATDPADTSIEVPDRPTPTMSDDCIPELSGG